MRRFQSLHLQGQVYNSSWCQFTILPKFPKIARKKKILVPRRRCGSGAPRSAKDFSMGGGGAKAGGGRGGVGGGLTDADVKGLKSSGILIKQVDNIFD